ncbi:CS1 type fimbrial major subunit [Pseudomonas sp. PDM31]|uniref:CS1 type fimbrial major subunit n=1 Tax=Pseudomonas sp. PDM31 TaxID=2854778 RepID=UPI001C47FA80|nr:CS1 type fimbrial major subunit [Pseudomonas sp. PDM31]MBV7479108.1 fimbrial protein [Pseudomonas sp. PDM31]
MFKKFAIAVPMTVLALSASMAFAADPINQVINIKAFVPTSLFNVAPQNPDFGRDETMTQQGSGDLTTVRGLFNMKHTDPKGAINALIDGDAALYNGRDSIPLTVTIGGVQLGNITKEVVSETESVPGVQREMVIKAATPTATQTGDYTTSFAVVFEPVLKP